MSLAGFLLTGKVEIFLVGRADKRPVHFRDIKGRPFVCYIQAKTDSDTQDSDVGSQQQRPKGTAADDQNALVGIILSPHAPVIDHQGARKIVESLNDMLEMPKKYKTDPLPAGRGKPRNVEQDMETDVYVLWEVWIDRVASIKDDAYTNEEIDVILNGHGQSSQCSVVRYIRKLESTVYEDHNHIRFYNSMEDFENDVQDQNINFPDDEKFTTSAYKFEKDEIWDREDLNMTLGGGYLNITNIGLSSGRPFRFPRWMYDQQHIDKLNTFVRTYNTAAMEIIKTRKPGAPITLKQRKRDFDNLNAAWFESWIECVKAGGGRPLNEWINTFSLNLLRNPKFSSMSVFTIFGEDTFEEMDMMYEKDNERDVVLTEEKEIDVSGLVDGFLLPTDKKLLMSWDKLESYKKMVGNLSVSLIDWCNQRPNIDAIEKSRTVYIAEKKRAQHKNIYELLLKSNGAQGQEHKTTSSFVGTGAHIKAALVALGYRNGQYKPGNRKIQTAISDSKILNEYEKEMPRIVDDVGEFLMTAPLEPRSGASPLYEYIRAVEFPVYLLDYSFDGGKRLYSRIDAVSTSFDLNDKSLSVWEFKTKWGTGNEMLQIFNDGKAPIGDIRQAAFYCYCLEKMTGNSPTYFYLRYVRTENVIDDPMMTAITIRYTYYDAKRKPKKLFDFENLFLQLKD